MIRREVNLSEVYDLIYKLADEYIREYNPCKIDEHGRCERSKPLNCTCCGGRFSSSGDNRPQTHICEHLGESGCTVKALYCKLWLCAEIKEKNPEVANKLESLLTLSQWLGIAGNFRATFRKSKEQTFAILQGTD